MKITIKTSPTVFARVYSVPTTKTMETQTDARMTGLGSMLPPQNKWAHLCTPAGTFYNMETECMEIITKRNHPDLGMLRGKRERAYMRATYGKNWYECDKATLKDRKAESALAVFNGWVEQ